MYMPLPITEKKFQVIIARLPKKDREKLKLRELHLEKLEALKKEAQDAMNRDLWVGIPWFVMYASSMFMFGLTSMTVLLFVLGMVYFVYSYFKFGHYGLNKLRHTVYEDLLREARI